MPAREDLPEGVVTFLFTDLEGSTRLLERDSAGTGGALARHFELLAGAVADHGGVVFETVGDAVYAAFARPVDAIVAALAGQRALAAEEWGAIGALRARMAIHSGPVERTGDHYFGPALFRCARLQALGHGGQTLLSQVVVERIGGELPPGATLRSLGSHRLKDLAEAEQVHQLDAPGLPTEFPALRSLGARPNNLPIEPTSFVGRAQEMAAVAAVLESSRLVTLMGPGGTGKTRLALQIAADQIDRYPDGVFFVQLAAVTDPADVLRTIATTLSIHDVPGESALAMLTYALRDHTMFLVLDNLEQIADAGPEVAVLLGALPGLTCLATSRVALNVQGERRWPVPPLALPPATDPHEPDAVAAFETVRLFIDRARDIRPDFALTSGNAADVAAICRRLDGLPLAIELAAARTNVFEPSDLLARLDHRLAMLSSGARDVPERQRTLRGAIAWSWDLLAPQEQSLAALLAVFVGGCTFEAIEALCADVGDVTDPLASVAKLVDASLVRRSPAFEGPVRFMMLETIREFAAERLEGRPDAEAVHRRHAQWVAEFVEAAELRGSAMPLWLERIELDHDNIRAALDWSIRTSDGETARRIVAALWKFWWLHGHFSEGRGWADAALALSVGISDAEAGSDLAGALYAAGLMWGHVGEPEGAIPLLRRAVSIYRRGGPSTPLAAAIADLALSLFEAREVAEATERYRESLEMSHEIGDLFQVGLCLTNMSLIALERGDMAGAQRLAGEAEAMAVKAGDPELLAASRLTLAGVLERGGREADAGRVLALVFDDLADLHSNFHSAAGLLTAVRVLDEVAPDLAIRCFATAETTLRAGSSGRILRSAEADLETTRRYLIDAIGSETFEAAYAEGAAVSLEQAIEEARDALRDLAANAAEPAATTMDRD